MEFRRINSFNLRFTSANFKPGVAIKVAQRQDGIPTRPRKISQSVINKLRVRNNPVYEVIDPYQVPSVSEKMLWHHILTRPAATTFGIVNTSGFSSPWPAHASLVHEPIESRRPSNYSLHAGPGDIKFSPWQGFDLNRDTEDMIIAAMSYLNDPQLYSIYLRRIDIIYNSVASHPPNLATALPVLQELANRFKVILCVSHRKALPHEDALTATPEGVLPHELEINGVAGPETYAHMRPAPANVREIILSEQRMIQACYDNYAGLKESIALLDCSQAELRDLFLACLKSDSSENDAGGLSPTHSSFSGLIALVNRLNWFFILTGEERYAIIQAIVASRQLDDNASLSTVFNLAFQISVTLCESGMRGKVEHHHVLREIAHMSIEEAVHTLGIFYRFQLIPATLLAQSDKETMLNWLVNILAVGHSFPEMLNELVSAMVPLCRAGLSGESLSRYLFDIIFARGVTDIDARVFVFFFKDVQPSQLAEHLATFKDFFNSLNRGDSHGLRMAVLGKIFEDRLISTRSKILDRLELYTDIMRRWPLTGYVFLLEVMYGDWAILDAGTDADSVLEFIDRYHSFHPVLFALFMRDKKAFQDKITADADRMLTSYVGGQDLERMAHSYVDMLRDGLTDHRPQPIDGNELDDPSLLEEIQLALMEFISPVTVTTPVQYADKLARFHMLKALGDVSSHVPAAWVDADGRCKPYAFQLDRYQWHRKSTAHLPNAQLDAAIHALKLGRDQEPVWKEYTTVGIRESLRTHLMVFADFMNTQHEEEARKHVLEYFFAIAGYTPELRPSIHKLDLKDYDSLRRLENLFESGGGLREILAAEMRGKEIQTSRYKTIAESQAAGLVKQIRKCWTFPPQSRRPALSNLLRLYLASEIEVKLLQAAFAGDTDTELRQIIRDVMSDQPTAKHNEIINRLLNPYLDLIRSEKQNFKQTKLPIIGNKPFQISVRPVMSLAFSGWGFTAGVCLGDDLEFMSNPNTRLVAITEENSKTIVGFACLVDLFDGDKKYLVVPGIDPHQGFLDQLDADEFFAGVIAGLTMLAKAGGYAGLYLPTPNKMQNGDDHIISNRDDITAAALRVQKRDDLTIKKIASLRWNSKPEPLLINEVIVFWLA